MLLNTVEIIEAAYRRVRFPLERLTPRHKQDAYVAMTLVSASWATQGVQLWQVFSTSIALAVNQTSITLPADVLEIVGAVRRVNGFDYPLTSYTFGDYIALTNKTQEGTPSIYYHQRQDNTLKIWPVPPAVGISIVYWHKKRLSDAATGVEGPNIAYLWQEAFIAELAFRLAMELPEIPLQHVQYLEVQAKARYNEAYLSAELDGEMVEIGYA